MKANILKELRLNAKLTQKELAKKIGVAHNTIAMIETGKREGDRETSRKIADFFGVSLDYLEGRDNDTNVSKNTSSLVDDFLNELINNGIIKDPNNIDDETAEMILNAVKVQIALKIKKNKRNEE